MHTGLTLRTLGIGLIAAAAASAPALAEGEVTFIGTGTIDGVQNVVPVEWLGEIGSEQLRQKGEVVLDAEGALAAARIEAPGLLVTITPNEGSPVYNFVVEHEGERRTYGLTRVRATLEGDLRVRGRLIGDGVAQRLDLVVVDPEIVEGKAIAGDATLGGIGPDVTTSRIGLDDGTNAEDWVYWGTANGIRAFSMATTSCNVGDATAEWISGNQARHPVIGQNIFRIQNDRFEHIGQSWLKHSFCAVSEFTCGACQPTNCGTLGIGCADTYWAALNDGQGGGAKADIIAMNLGSTHTHPYTTPDPGTPAAIRGRLQVRDADILAGGRFFAEAQYVTHDEPLANRHNNASWREIQLGLTSITGVGVGQPSVHFQESAIQAWAQISGATIKEVTIPEEGGRVHVGFLVTQLEGEGGTWHYEYAVHNLNSDRAVRSFSLPVPECATITNIGFHDVDYHSGEPYDGTDWEAVVENGSITWSTQTFGENGNANAIRWGTAYNFRFDADMPPGSTAVTLGLFTPDNPPSVQTAVQAPAGKCDGCVGDIDGSGAVDVDDMLALIGVWGPCPGCDADLDDSGVVDVDDLLILLGAWGPCP